MTTENNELTPPTDAAIQMGRRKLIQALTAASGAAILGGLELKWQAPFVQISTVMASRFSVGYNLYDEFRQSTGDEDSLTLASNNEANNRTVIQTANGHGLPKVNGSIELNPGVSGEISYSTFLAKVQNGATIAISETGIGANANESPIANVIVNTDETTRWFDVTITGIDGVGTLRPIYTSDSIINNELNKVELVFGSTVMFYVVLAETDFEVVISVDSIEKFLSWENSYNDDVLPSGYPALAVVSMVKIAK